jgi:hypothetical protein
MKLIMQPKGVKPEVRERKLGSGANWRAAVKQNFVKQGLVVYVHVISTKFKTKSQT